MTPNRGRTRSIVVPESFFLALERGLERDLDSATTASVLYDVGREAGRSWFEENEAESPRETGDEDDFRDFLQTVGGEYGWADIEVKAFDVQGRFAVVGWRNALGVEQEKRHVPACHIGRGLLSGAAASVFGADCDAIETQCQAMGADHCEIVVGPADRVAAAAEGVELGLPDPHSG